tara:strand:- start:5084 stop:6391 length:1308 start_codon:yes stop_codon:yes gene_type:complete
MALLSSTEFYRRHNTEFEKYIYENEKTLIISNIDSGMKINERNNLDLIEFDLDQSFDSQIAKFTGKYDLIILSDVFEVSQDIIKFLNLLRVYLNIDGRIIIASINPIWNIPLKILENLKIKKDSKNRSYIHLKKFSTVLSSVGFEVLSSRSRQYFPFKFFYIGSFINSFFEIILYFLNSGIRTYIIIKEINYKSEFREYTKTIIVPAKNEEGNLVSLVNRIPNLGKNTEVIVSCGKSKDNTLQVAKELKSNHLTIKVIEQTKNGKANAVWEALNISTGEIIAILDADISVDPEKLTEFFKIISLNRADFVNGTRLIYNMEKGAMKLINNIGNRVFQFIVSIIIGLPLTDSLCGTKVFKRSLYEKIHYWQSSVKIKDPFGDFDLLFSAAYSGHKILELPIHYRTRTYGKTQIRKYRDGFTLIRYLLRSFYKFNSSS